MAASPITFLKRATCTIATALVVGSLPDAASAQPPRQPAAQTADSAAVQAHIDAARAMATGALETPFDFFCVPGNARANSFTAPNMVPVRLFDNFYALGNSETVVHVITTSAGLVLIDAGMPDEVETVLVPGLRALGLDPADVHTLLLGHGHADHFGGAAWFQDNHGTRIGTTDADWETIANDDGRLPAPKPARDLVIRDGEPLVFGDTEIMPVAVPGHTPGGLAFIFTVYDGGVPHTAGLFGGTVLTTGFVRTPGLVQYIDSIDRYLEVARRMGVDVEVQNHPIFDDTPARLAALADRTPGEPHPFVMGVDQYQLFWRIISECMQAELVRREEAGQ